MKTSLLTTTYNATQARDPLKAVSFQIHPEPQGFKLANGIMGMLYYTLDGKTATKHPDNTTFMAIRMNGSVAVNDQKEYAIDRFKKMPGGMAFNNAQIYQKQFKTIARTFKRK